MPARIHVQMNAGENSITWPDTFRFEHEVGFRMRGPRHASPRAKQDAQPKRR
jgi:hypothetical protein